MGTLGICGRLQPNLLKSQRRDRAFSQADPSHVLSQKLDAGEPQAELPGGHEDEEADERKEPGRRPFEDPEERGCQRRSDAHGVGEGDVSAGASSSSRRNAVSTFAISSPYRAKSPSRNAACASSKWSLA